MCLSRGSPGEWSLRQELEPAILKRAMELFVRDKCYIALPPEYVQFKNSSRLVLRKHERMNRLDMYTDIQSEAESEPLIPSTDTPPASIRRLLHSTVFPCILSTLRIFHSF